jgi:hypothetical protein
MNDVTGSHHRLNEIDDYAAAFAKVKDDYFIGQNRSTAEDGGGDYVSNHSIQMTSRPERRQWPDD